jgi:hypothetical protein
MTGQPLLLTENVTLFLDNLKHPLREAIELLRAEILLTNSHLTENIKWNSPNYSLKGNDCITIRIQPAKQLQLVFHRGAKVQSQPGQKLITDHAGLLDWKTNDRAVATFRTADEIRYKKGILKKVIVDWLAAVA